MQNGALGMVMTTNSCHFLDGRARGPVNEVVAMIWC